jgi:glycosyltransferase involved in cell wall biosynthesis
MDIAVIIPVYNGAKFLEETLQSVLNQSLLPQEIIVVDDGSQDESTAIVKTFPQIKLLFNPDKGAPSARNFGLKNSNSSLIVFLDQDDLWHKDHLQILSNLLAKNPQACAIFSQAIKFSETKKLSFSPPIENPELFDIWQWFPTTRIVCPSTVLIRRSALDLIGGWPTAYIISDTYGWFMLGANAPMIKNVSVTVGYRIHEQSSGEMFRSQKRLTIFDEQINALKNAVSYRLNFHPEDEEKLNHRLKALMAMSNISKAIIKSDFSTLQQLTILCEENLINESEEIINLMFIWFIWFINPIINSDYQFLDHLIKYWSKNTPKTYKSLILALSPSTVIKYVKNKPLNLNSWFLLIRIITARILSNKLKGSW